MFPDQVRIVLRYTLFHEGSDEAARILEAARMQNKFEPVLDALFEEQPGWAFHGSPEMDVAWEIAANAGLDVERAETDKLFHPGCSHFPSSLCAFHGEISPEGYSGRRATMLIHLHSQATTTPKVRAAIQESDEVGTVLAERFGDEADQKTIRGIVFLPNAQTICKWRKRDSVEDRSHRPHRLQTTLTPAQEGVAVALRKALLVSLDDLLALAIVLEPMAHKARSASS